MAHWKDIFAKPRPGFAKSAAIHCGWTLLSAVMLLLAFPRPGWGWLAHIALVPVTVLAIRSHSPRMLAGCVYLVFAIWWIWMLRWLMPVTGGGSIGLAMFMAAYWTVAILIVRHIHRAFRSAMVITLPMVWVSFELLRGWAPQGGFGWFNIGCSQGPYLPEHAPGILIQIADVFGQPGVSFLVAMTNGLVVDFLTRSMLKRRGTASQVTRKISRTLAVGSLLWVMAYLGAMGYGLLAFRQEAEHVKRSVQLAVIQTAVPQSNKDASIEVRTGQGEKGDDAQARREQLLAEQEAYWQDLLEKTRQAAAMHPKPDAVVWPETMVPQPINQEAVDLFKLYESPSVRAYGRYAEQIPFLAASLQTNLVVGSSSLFDINITEDDRLDYRTANSVFIYDAQGIRDAKRYDKMHRVPFGEYIPWVDSWPWLKAIFLKYLSPYDFDYSLTPGKRVEVFTVRKPGAQEAPLAADRSFRIVTPICFEDSVPRLVRSMVYDPATGRKRADVIVNLTNDGWFSGTDQPLQHLQIAAFRSIELRVPTARAVNMGVSGFIDSMGRIGPLVQTAGKYQDVSGIASAAVQLDSRSSFYGSVGPVGSIGVGLVTILLTVCGIFRRRGAVGDRRQVV